MERHFADIQVHVFSSRGTPLLDPNTSLNSSKSEEHLRKSVTDLFCKVSFSLMLIQWGTLLNVKVLKDWANRPFSFVQYTTAQEATYALSQCQKSILDGRMIRVERARVNRTLYIVKDKGKIEEAVSLSEMTYEGN
jgi:hypothetical protein